MKLFAGLRKIREFEKLRLPFLKSMIDFDIVIEIGYQEECGEPLTLKRLYLLEVCSPGTMRRKLARLTSRGIVIRQPHPTDGRASLLLIAPSALKLIGKYSSAIASAASLHFR
jgi:DNA-binding MarR family transcriptional regulator